MRRCKTCNKGFTPGREWSKFCSSICRSEDYRCVSQYPNLNPGTVGAISELRVATDLLIKGYEVFRALSPHASCDLAILRDGKLLRVEVRTGYENKNGTAWATRNHKADVMAICVPSRIVYEPSL